MKLFFIELVMIFIKKVMIFIKFTAYYLLYKLRFFDKYIAIKAQNGLYSKIVNTDCSEL